MMSDTEDSLDKWETEKPVVDFDDNGEPITSITLNLPNGIVKFDETDYYARKLATILDSPRIKEEIGEQLIANYELKTGLIFKKTTSWYVTNYRIFSLNEEQNSLTQFPLKYVDIVVNNTHSVSERNGAIVGGMVPGFMYAGMGFTQGQSMSKRIGDVNFLVNGQILMIIPEVVDPNGLKQMLIQIKKQIHEEQ